MKKFSQFLFLVLVFVLAFTSVTFAQSVVWKFAKVEPNPFSSAPDLVYSVEMTMIVNGSGGWVVGTGYYASELKPLLKYFKVNSPEELTGKTFKSTEGDASSALDLLKIQLLHKFNHTPPTAEALYERAAKALAKMQLPDFSDVAKKDVFRAYQEVFAGFTAKPEWRTSFKAKIQRYSKGEVQLTEADYEQFSMRARGPAEYLLLVSKSGEKKRVILGPYSTPISFDQED